MPDPSPVIENQLLAALPAKIYQRLMPHLEKVTLKLRQVLYEAGDPINNVYFPHRTLLSIISKFSSGRFVEAGMVGGESEADIEAWCKHTLIVEAFEPGAHGDGLFAAYALLQFLRCRSSNSLRATRSGVDDQRSSFEHSGKYRSGVRRLVAALRSMEKRAATSRRTPDDAGTE